MSWLFGEIAKQLDERDKVNFEFYDVAASELTQRSCDNVDTTSLLTLSQRCGTVKNESCTDVSFRRCDNVALQRCQDVATTLLQRRHSIKHWISRSFYYGLFWFLSRHRNMRELQKCYAALNMHRLSLRECSIYS